MTAKEKDQTEQELQLVINQRLVVEQQQTTTNQSPQTSNLVNQTNQLALSSPVHSQLPSPSATFSPHASSSLLNYKNNETADEGACPAIPASESQANDFGSKQQSNNVFQLQQPTCSLSSFNNEQLPKDQQQVYHVKYISWNTGTIPIIMQSINGSCPLLAIVNVLSLREKLKLPASSAVHETISSDELLQLIGECLMECVPNEIKEDNKRMLDFEQNINDAIEILPKLATGLDVNIKFSGIFDFEYTSECIIFDLLRIPLFHGWLVEPSSAELTKVIENKSYNQLVDYIISNKNSSNMNVRNEVCVAEMFLNSSASQLTEYGLKQLKTNINDNEIGILFRNNHFSTIFKHEGELYQLVTDHGFSKEDITWETLDSIDGSSRFLTSNFLDPKRRESDKNQSSDEKHQNLDYYYDDAIRQRQMENDFLMALSLKQEEENQGKDNWNVP